MIEIYVTNVEAYEDNELVFRDEETAELTIDKLLVSPGDLDGLFDAIRQALAKMKLAETGHQECPKGLHD